LLQVPANGIGRVSHRIGWADVGVPHDHSAIRTLAHPQPRARPAAGPVAGASAWIARLCDASAVGLVQATVQLTSRRVEVFDQGDTSSAASTGCGRRSRGGWGRRERQAHHESRADNDPEGRAAALRMSRRMFGRTTLVASASRWFAGTPHRSVTNRTSWPEALRSRTDVTSHVTAGCARVTAGSAFPNTARDRIDAFDRMNGDGAVFGWDKPRREARQMWRREVTTRKRLATNAAST
jgi:hypothetical protein